MADQGGDGRSRRLLARIARTLDVPPERFLCDSAPERRAPSVAEEAEEAELLALFRGLREPDDRRRCIELVRSLVIGPGRDRTGPR